MKLFALLNRKLLMASKEKLQQMLVLSDFVKFAKVIPIEQEQCLALQSAFDFVNGTKREDEIQIEETNE